MVTQKLVDDQWIDIPQTLANLSDEDITMICHVMRRPGGLVYGKMLDMGNQTSFLMAKNSKLAVIMLKTMEHCSRTYDIRHVNSTSVLKCQHHWELEHKERDNIEESKVDKNNWKKL